MTHALKAHLRPLVAATLACLFAAPTSAPAQSDRGAKLFEECAACHAAKPRGPDDVGPALGGVVGRKAASRDDFRYSGPMRRSGLTWDRATLDRYLADPQAAVPGTRMPYSGMPNAEDRKALIDYLDNGLK